MTLIGLPCIIDAVIFCNMVLSIHWSGCCDAVGVIVSLQQDSRLQILVSNAMQDERDGTHPACYPLGNRSPHKRRDQTGTTCSSRLAGCSTEQLISQQPQEESHYATWQATRNTGRVT